MEAVELAKRIERNAAHLITNVNAAQWVKALLAEIKRDAQLIVRELDGREGQNRKP